MEKHAISKRDVALAKGTRSLSSLKTGVRGKGKYKVWTAHAMMKVACLSAKLCYLISLLGLVSQLLDSSISLA